MGHSAHGPALSKVAEWLRKEAGIVAVRVAHATEREVANETLVALGFVYPDALDIRSAFPRGNSHIPVRGTASQPSSALSRTSPDPGPAIEPPAVSSPAQSREADAAPSGGTP